MKRHATAAFLLLLTLACTDGDKTVTPTSTPKSTGAPLPLARTEVAGTVWADRIVVVGGYLADGASSAQVDLYDPKTNTWSRLPDLPAQVNHSGTAVLGDRLYVAGGFSPTAPDTSVWSLGDRETSWRTEPPLPHGRGAHALVSTGSVMYAIGGVHGRDLVPDVDVLTTGAQRWTSAGRLAEPREHLAATLVGETLYVIAGRIGSPAGNRRTVEIREPDGTWRRGPDLNTARGGIAAATVGSASGTRIRPCVTGGETPTVTIATVECLIDGEWRFEGNLAIPRHGLAVVALGGVLHVIGGGPKPGLFVSDAHEILRVDTG